MLAVVLIMDGKSFKGGGGFARGWENEGLEVGLSIWEMSTALPMPRGWGGMGK